MYMIYNALYMTLVEVITVRNFFPGCVFAQNLRYGLPQVIFMISSNIQQYTQAKNIFLSLAIKTYQPLRFFNAKSTIVEEQ